MDKQPLCSMCDEPYNPLRYEAGYTTCLNCGDKQATKDRESWCIAPMHKSNYQLITNKAELVGLNNKGGLVKNDT